MEQRYLIDTNTIIDAIIEATTIVMDFTLITNNEKDFEGIENIKIINPYKI